MAISSGGIGTRLARVAVGAAVAAVFALSCRPSPARTELPSLAEPTRIPAVADAAPPPPLAVAREAFTADDEIALVPIPAELDSTGGAERLSLAGGVVLTPLAHEESYHPDPSSRAVGSKSRRWCAYAPRPPRVAPTEVYPLLPPHDTVVWKWSDMGCWEALIVRGPALVTIADVTQASVFPSTVDTRTTVGGRTTVTRTAAPLVSVEVSSAASERLTKWSEAHPGEKLAVVVRGLSVQEWRVARPSTSFTVSTLGPKATAGDFRELARRLDPLTRAAGSSSSHGSR